MAMSEESPPARPGGRRPMRCRSPRSRLVAVSCIHPPPLPRIHGAINTSPEIHSFRSPRRRIIILSAQLKRAPHKPSSFVNEQLIGSITAPSPELTCIEPPWKREGHGHGKHRG
nr:unnamed protein product [Digitaria exilis]